MKRYLGQKNDGNCAPIMIVNLLKWSGQQATSKDIPQLCRMMNTLPNEGTYDKDTDGVLRCLPGIKVSKYRYEKKIEPIKNALNKGKAVIISYYYTPVKMKTGGHIFLCIEYKNNKFKVVNEAKTTVGNISSAKMSGLLRRKGTKVWIASKDNNNDITKRARYRNK